MATRFSLVLVVGSALFFETVSDASAQKPGKRPPILRLPRQANVPPRPAEDPRAREILRLFLTNGQRQSYAGEQMTRLLQGRVQESQQVVKRLGAGRERMEYFSPANLRGEVMLLHGGRLLHYKPQQNQILEGPDLQEDFQNRVRELMQMVKERRISVQVVGEQLVAERNAAIVEIRPLRSDAPFTRLWIDEQTGVRLRIEKLDNRGNVVSETFFTKIDYAATLNEREFRPDALPNVPHLPLWPDIAPLGSVQEAQRQVAYDIREPAVPTGFRLNGVWVLSGAGNRHTTVFRYSDGVNTFALFQHPIAPRNAPVNKPLRVRPRNNVANWSTDDRLYTLIGNLRPETVDQIVGSLR